MADALTAGFDGQMTEADVVGWARLVSGLSVSLEGYNDWRATAVAGADRTVSVAAGVGYGHAIKVNVPVAKQVQLAPVASGVRFDLVAWELNWNPGTPGGTCTLVAIPGTSVQQKPTVAQDPGVGKAYIPIALAKVTAGIQSPTVVDDYRQWGAQPITAVSLAGIDFPRPGQQVMLTDGTSWRRDVANTKWDRQLDRKLWWQGTPNGNIADGTSYTNQYAYPALQSTAAGGPVTLPAAVGGARVTVPAGAYIVSAWLNTADTNAIVAVSVNSTTSLTTKASAPAAGVALNMPNGGSGPLILTSDSNLVFGWRFTGSFNGAATYVKILRLGDA